MVSVTSLALIARVRIRRAGPLANPLLTCKQGLAEFLQLGRVECAKVWFVSEGAWMAKSI